MADRKPSDDQVRQAGGGGVIAVLGLAVLLYGWSRDPVPDMRFVVVGVLLAIVGVRAGATSGA